MARAVSPWLHRVMLRDHGPSDPTMKLCLLIVNAFMDESGFCYPTQEQVAAAACLCVASVRTKLAAASKLGWLARYEGTKPGQRWKSQEYRAAVPDGIEIPSKHEAKHSLWQAEHGVDIPPEALRGTLFPKSREQKERERQRRKGPPPVGGASATASATPSSRTAKSRSKDRYLAIEGPLSDSEEDRQQVAPKYSTQEGYVSDQLQGRSPSGSQPPSDVRAITKDIKAARPDVPLDVRLGNARKLLAEVPEFPIDQLRAMYQLTPEQVSEARRLAP